jgi:hypothetical protein
MIRQARTGDTVIVKSQWWLGGGEGAKTTENQNTLAPLVRSIERTKAEFFMIAFPQCSTCYFLYARWPRGHEWATQRYTENTHDPLPFSVAQGIFWLSWAGIFKKSMGARHRGGIGFSYRPARLHRLAVHSLESIPGPHKHLKVRALRENLTRYITFNRGRRGGSVLSYSRTLWAVPR